jgi:hypothetical protein
MRNEIWASIIWVALAMTPLSDLKAANSTSKVNFGWLWDDMKAQLIYSLNEDNYNEIILHWAKESESLLAIDEKTIIDAALSYFDEEVKLYSLKWEAREKVKSLLKDYLSAHPILKKNANGGILFIIDNKQEFASMIKKLANTLFDWMPRVIRDIAIFLVFGWNNELQKTLDNLDSTVLNLASKQYKDIVFDYFWSIVKRVASNVGWEMTVGEYYNSVNKYYPNKNHNQILNELERMWQLDNNMVNLKYPFKK